MANLRSYQKKFVKNFVDRRVNQRTETRDGILWDIDDGNFRCRVKIQGSGEFIVAHFPRNWKRRPYWLKVGNAVRILHRSGVRGYIEVIGEGRAIPLPVEGPAIPEHGELPDAIIAGLEMYPTSPESMAVIITSGTYRIGGQIYYFTGELVNAHGIVMDDPAPMTMGSGEIMLGSTEYTVQIDPAPAYGFYRYDAFVIGIAGEIIYLKGTEARENPVRPLIPSDHLLIGNYIFVRWNTTEITSSDIGSGWATRVISGIAIELQYPDGMPWSGSTNTPYQTVKATVVDQYGVAVSAGSGNAFTIKLTKTLGEGQVWSAQSGYHDDEVQNTCSSYYNFRYYRNQLAIETPVLLMAELLGDSYPNVYGFQRLDLYDSNGFLIT